MKTTVQMKLQPPWVEFEAQVRALFGSDPGVKVEYTDTPKRTLTLRVESHRKADAIRRLMPTYYDFGNIRVIVVVIPANRDGDVLPADACTADVVAAAFKGNPVVTQVRQVSKGLFKDLSYCVFSKEVVQYPIDNLADINGNRSVLMEDIAREILTDANGVYFCTSAGRANANGFGDAPLGEWP